MRNMSQQKSERHTALLESSAFFKVLLWFMLFRAEVVNSTLDPVMFCKTTLMNGTAVRALDPPSLVIPGVKNTGCALQCLTNPQTCVAYNYNKDNRTCEIYNSAPNKYVKAGNTTNYQAVDTSLAGNGAYAAGIPSIPSTSCEFPFTYLGQRYYTCIQATFNVPNYCNAFVCISDHRNWSSCTSQTDYTSQTRTISLNINNTVLPEIVNSINGWITFQQRIDGSTDFNPYWASFKSGFGLYSTNYWMGLEKIYQLTASGNYKLRFEVRLKNVPGFATDQWFSDVYDSFYLDSESPNSYAIHVSGYSGDNGDVMNEKTLNSGKYFHNGMPFSTKDKNKINCVTYGDGGWWHNSCFFINLNGIWGTNDGNHGAQYYVYSKASWSFITECRMMMKSI